MTWVMQYEWQVFECINTLCHQAMHVPKKGLPCVYVPSTSDNKLVSSGPLPKGFALASVLFACWSFSIGINSSLYQLRMIKDKIRNTCIVEYCYSEVGVLGL